MKIDRFRLPMLAAWAGAALFCAQAFAATSVQVLETWPAGTEVSLPSDQHFRVRLAYSSDTPKHISMKPYFRGKAVQNAATNPSEQHLGKGETQVWFFFMKPGGEVDEIRITAGDGRSNKVIGSYRVHIVGNALPAPQETPPRWVAELGGIAAAPVSVPPLTPAPMSAMEKRVESVMVAIMLCGGLTGLTAPIWMTNPTRRKWLMASGMLMGAVALNLALDVARHPTSHNQWPLEFILAGMLGLGVSAALRFFRKLRELRGRT